MTAEAEPTFAATPNSGNCSSIRFYLPPTVNGDAVS